MSFYVYINHKHKELNVFFFIPFKPFIVPFHTTSERLQRPVLDLPSMLILTS